MTAIANLIYSQTLLYPQGYISVRLQDAKYRKALKHLGGGWRAPIHGCWVFAADDGTPLAQVRTLGHQLPKKDRRYALRVHGVLFTRMQPLVSTKRPINSEVASYLTPKEAMQAGSKLIADLRKGDQ